MRTKQTVSEGNSTTATVPCLCLVCAYFHLLGKSCFHGSVRHRKLNIFHKRIDIMKFYVIVILSYCDEKVTETGEDNVQGTH